MSPPTITARRRNNGRACSAARQQLKPWAQLQGASGRQPTLPPVLAAAAGSAAWSCCCCSAAAASAAAAACAAASAGSGEGSGAAPMATSPPVVGAAAAGAPALAAPAGVPSAAASSCGSLAAGGAGAGVPASSFCCRLPQSAVRVPLLSAGGALPLVMALNIAARRDRAAGPRLRTTQTTTAAPVLPEAPRQAG